MAGITKVAAIDCGPHRIHVNAICPGYTATDMTKGFKEDKDVYNKLSAMYAFKGLGEVEDIANAFLFLASPDNTWMTGVLMPVDGGYTAV